MKNKKISIITICYNAEKHIQDTFSSIRSQTNQEFEYIVIDGGSTDRTLEIIERNKDIIDYWKSEPDNGISDALNKGVTNSTGDYIVYLHADDYFYSDQSIETALNMIEGDVDILAFDIYFEEKGKRRLGSPRGFGWYTNFKMPFYHPGIFCKRTLFSYIGNFDTQFKIAMDYDFLLRAYNANASSAIVHEPLTVFRDTGISSKNDWTSLMERFSEEKRTHYKNSNSPFLIMSYFLWWVLYPTYRKIRHYSRF